MAFSTAHTRDTENPQTYYQHWRVAFFGSLWLIAYGIGGLIHSFFPWIKMFQFWTSSGIIGIYRALELSRRHDPEIKNIFGEERYNYIRSHRGN